MNEGALLTHIVAGQNNYLLMGSSISSSDQMLPHLNQQAKFAILSHSTNPIFQRHFIPLLAFPFIF
jgi:hypothetical protein